MVDGRWTDDGRLVDGRLTVGGWSMDGTLKERCGICRNLNMIESSTLTLTSTLN